MKLLSNLRRERRGFTLIEIVIVLAIAALILVIVFLAIAGAQRSQRDNASSNAAGRVAAAYVAYLADNKNVAPTSDAAMANYLVNVSEGHGIAPKIATAGSAAVASPAYTFWYMPKGVCAYSATAPGDTVVAGGGDTQVAIVYYSEQKKLSVCKQN